MISKRENWGFIDLGKVNVESIEEEVLRYESEWDNDVSRQHLYETHEHTFFVPILKLDYHHEIGSSSRCEKVGSLNSDAAKKELKDLVLFFEKYANGKTVRIEIVGMKANSRVRTHKDRSDLLYLARRFHVPLKTNAQVTFISGKHIAHLEKYHAYELNNINYHSVFNKSNESRIHLIIDVLPNEHLGGIEFDE